MDFNPAKSHQASATSGEASSLFYLRITLVKKLFSGGYSIITHASVLLMGQELLEGVSA